MVFSQNFIVVVKANGRILREKQVTESTSPAVYIPFNTEYSLLFKNKHSRAACVKVEIDGQDVLNGRELIVNANSEVELERFLDTMSEGRRFKFIKKIQEIVEHRGDKIDDGIVRVEYRFEKEKPETKTITTTWAYFPPIHEHHHHHHHYPSYPSPIIYCNSVGSSIRQSSASSNVNGQATSASYSCSNVVADNCCADIVTPKAHVPMKETDLSYKKPELNQDEGITVKGSVSKQQFQQSYVGALEENAHVICLQLRGETVTDIPVTQPITVQTKFECTSCGKSHSSDKSYCDRCGTALVA